MLAFILAPLVIAVAAAPSRNNEESAHHVTKSASFPMDDQAGMRSAWLSHHAHHHHSHTRPHHPAVSPTASSAAAVETPSSIRKHISKTSSKSDHVTMSPKPTAGSKSVVAAASPDDYLKPHNRLRAMHSAPPLKWSPQLANAAHIWASQCKWAHSMGSVGNYGENIAAGTEGFNATSAVAAWAAEEPQYDPKNAAASHYTQMVWKATTELGCSVASCPGLLNADVAQLHVCEYFVPGNVQGQFQVNVS